jgi:hypothetical protein
MGLKKDFDENLKKLFLSDLIDDKEYLYYKKETIEQLGLFQVEVIANMIEKLLHIRHLIDFSNPFDIVEMPFLCS